MAVIGIDLGTTNSAVGVWKDGEVKLIPNRLDEILTPSVVGLDDHGKVFIGRTAKERLLNYSSQTVATFKRMMGSDHKIRLNKQVFSAVELSSLLLGSLKEDAEAFLGEAVTEAVISVPAYFNNHQREATKLAGELAGLNVERLINEPTAAAIAYGLHEKNEGTFLILDMGGGTFDVSILEFFDGVMEVHASAGDNFLGGEDFVDVMVDGALSELNIDRSSLTPRQRQHIYMQMETAKRRINQESSQAIVCDLGQTHHQFDVTPDWFVKMVTPLLLRIKHPISRAIKDSGLSLKDIDEIILVGGATRMSAFRSTVGKFFGRLPTCHIDPDTVVVHGAAIQAGLKSRDAALEDIVLTDVCPYTLGTAIANEDNAPTGHYFMPIIERNSVVPISIERQLFTASDNQTVVHLKVYQGENRLVDKNIFLGEVIVDVPKGPRGQESINVRYSYNMNGLLEVDVTVVSTQKKGYLLIEQTPGALSEEQKSALLEKLARFKFHPRDQEGNKALIARGERLYESNLGEKREYIAHLLAQFDSVMEKQNRAEIKKARKEITAIFDQIDQEDWI